MSDTLVDRGNATVYITDMDRALAFYVDTLGMTLAMRAGNDWAAVSLPGLSIGLHVAQAGGTKPGTPGSITIGLNVAQPIGDVVGALEARGVTFHGPVVDSGFVKLAFFSDPDGNALYLAEPPGRP